MCVYACVRARHVALSIDSCWHAVSFYLFLLFFTRVFCPKLICDSICGEYFLTMFTWLTHFAGDPNVSFKLVKFWNLSLDNWSVQILFLKENILSFWIFQNTNRSFGNFKALRVIIVVEYQDFYMPVTQLDPFLGSVDISDTKSEGRTATSN